MVDIATHRDKQFKTFNRTFHGGIMQGVVPVQVFLVPDRGLFLRFQEFLDFKLVFQNPIEEILDTFLKFQRVDLFFIGVEG